MNDRKGMSEEKKKALEAKEESVRAGMGQPHDEERLARILRLNVVKNHDPHSAYLDDDENPLAFFMGLRNALVITVIGAIIIAILVTLLF